MYSLLVAIVLPDPDAYGERFSELAYEHYIFQARLNPGVRWQHMKKPSVAFLLSFLLPGAGLAYLGKWKWAIINLAVVLLVGILAAFLLPEDIFDGYIRYIAFGCAGGSSGLAQQLAVQMNREASNGDVT